MSSFTAYLQHKSRRSLPQEPTYATEAEAVQGLLDLLVRRGFLEEPLLQTPQTLAELRDLLHDVGDPVYTNPRNEYQVYIEPCLNTPINPFFAWFSEFEVHRDGVHATKPILSAWVHIQHFPEDPQEQMVGLFFRVPPEWRDELGNIHETLLDDQGHVRRTAETAPYFTPWCEPETGALYTLLRLEYIL